MKRKKGVFAVLTALTLGAVWLLSACSPAAVPAPSKAAGRDDNAFGTFETYDLQGEAVSQELFSGSRLTMVNVWATYCGPCLREMPDLGELAGSYQAADFQVVGVVSDTVKADGTYDDAQVAVAEQIIQRTGADYRHILPSQSLLSRLGQISAVPTTLFVDAQGRQVGQAYLGARTKAQWQSIVEGLLAQLPGQDAQSSAGTEMGSDAPVTQGTENVGFTRFETTDLLGRPVDQSVMTESAQELILALVWNPEWTGSTEALGQLAQLAAQDSRIQPLGLVVGDPAQAQALAQKAGVDFTNIILTPELETLLEAKAPQVLAFSPWGTVASQGLDADAVPEKWTQLIDEAVYNLYETCFS